MELQFSGFNTEISYQGDFTAILIDALFNSYKPNQVDLPLRFLTAKTHISSIKNIEIKESRLNKINLEIDTDISFVLEPIEYVSSENHKNHRSLILFSPSFSVQELKEDVNLRLINTSYFKALDNTLGFYNVDDHVTAVNYEVDTNAALFVDGRPLSDLSNQEGTFYFDMEGTFSYKKKLSYLFTVKKASLFSIKEDVFSSLVSGFISFSDSDVLLSGYQQSLSRSGKYESQSITLRSFVVKDAHKYALEEGSKVRLLLHDQGSTLIDGGFNIKQQNRHYRAWGE